MSRKPPPRPAPVNTAPMPTGRAAAPVTKSTRRPGAEPGLPVITLDEEDRTPLPMYVSSYAGLTDSGVDAVGGLKVLTDEGIRFPTSAKAPIAQTITTPTVPKRIVPEFVPPPEAKKDTELEDHEDEKHTKHKRHGHGHGHGQSTVEEVRCKASGLWTWAGTTVLGWRAHLALTPPPLVS